MNLWAVAYHSYDGDLLQGVFTSRDAAEAAVSNDPHPDWYVIHEITANQWGNWW